MNPADLSISPYIQGEITHQDTQITATIQLPGDYIGFQGHFPNNPILPSIYQALIAIQLLEGGLNTSLHLNTLSHAKFLGPILPEQPFTFLGKVTTTETYILASIRFADLNGTGISKFKLTLLAD